MLPGFYEVIWFITINNFHIKIDLAIFIKRIVISIIELIYRIYGIYLCPTR